MRCQLEYTNALEQSESKRINNSMAPARSTVSMTPRPSHVPCGRDQSRVVNRDSALHLHIAPHCQQCSIAGKPACILPRAARQGSTAMHGANDRNFVKSRSLLLLTSPLPVCAAGAQDIPWRANPAGCGARIPSSRVQDTRGTCPSVNLHLLLVELRSARAHTHTHRYSSKE